MPYLYKSIIYDPCTLASKCTVCLCSGLLCMMDPGTLASKYTVCLCSGLLCTVAPGEGRVADIQGWGVILRVWG